MPRAKKTPLQENKNLDVDVAPTAPVVDSVGGDAPIVDDVKPVEDTTPIAVIAPDVAPTAPVVDSVGGDAPIVELYPMAVKVKNTYMTRIVLNKSRQYVDAYATKTILVKSKTEHDEIVADIAAVNARLGLATPITLLAEVNHG